MFRKQPSLLQIPQNTQDGTDWTNALGSTPCNLTEWGPCGPVLDTRAIHTWVLPKVGTYLKKGRLLTGHWVGEPLGKSHRGAL